MGWVLMSEREVHRVEVLSISASWIVARLPAGTTPGCRFPKSQRASSSLACAAFIRWSVQS